MWLYLTNHNLSKLFFLATRALLEILELNIRIYLIKCEDFLQDRVYLRKRAPITFAELILPSSGVRKKIYRPQDEIKLRMHGRVDCDIWRSLLCICY